MALALNLQKIGPSGVPGVAMPVEVRRLVVAGWTGRDQTALAHHIEELEALGVKRPKSTPCYYTLTPDLLTTEGEVAFLGPDGTGEVEAVFYALSDGLWVGVGSDHTDRKVEAFSISVSKQICAKPVSRQVWRYTEIAPHWDQLILRAHIWTDGRRELYQEGPVSKMRPPEELMQRLPGGGMTSATALFCGTHPAIGGIRKADRFEMELYDPILGRSIQHSYAAQIFDMTGE